MLKKTVLFAALSLLMACNNESESPSSTAPENDVDAARTFIRAALNGNYKAAKNLIVQDSANLEWLATAERSYLQDSLLVQRGLRESSITLFNTEKLNDSVTMINYSNSFRKRNQKIKVLRQNGSWLVDLKYTFQNPDSSGK